MKDSEAEKWRVIMKSELMTFRFLLWAVRFAYGLKKQLPRKYTTRFAVIAAYRLSVPFARHSSYPNTGTLLFSICTRMPFGSLQSCTDDESTWESHDDSFIRVLNMLLMTNLCTKITGQLIIFWIQKQMAHKVLLRVRRTRSFNQ